MPSAETPSAQTQLEKPAEDEGKKEETREPSAQTPSAVAIRAGEACPPGARSPIPLEMLAERGAAVAAEEAARPSSRELLRISEATEIFDTEDDTGSEDEEVESVRGTPMGVLCEEVIPLLQYFDRKAMRYADPRHRGSYVELVKNRTRIKVATNPELIALDLKCRQLEEKYNCLQEHCALSLKLQR